MDKSIQQYSDGERLEALTQIYVELSLPLQVAHRAAEADLCYHDARQSARPSSQCASRLGDNLSSWKRVFRI